MPLKKVAGASPPRASMGLPSHNFNKKSFYLPLFFFLVLKPKRLGFMQCTGSSFHDGSEFSHAMSVRFKLFSAEERPSKQHTSRESKMKCFRGDNPLIIQYLNRV